MLASNDLLGLAGLALLVLPPSGTVLGYDIAVLVGFIMSVVLRHALLILPAIAQVRLPYGPALYGPLLLLHPSVRAPGGFGSCQLASRAALERNPDGQ
ncbi:hypothetical protein PKCBPO_00774 [Methylorubrum thiocyanatum]